MVDADERAPTLEEQIQRQRRRIDVYASWPAFEAAISTERAILASLERLQKLGGTGTGTGTSGMFPEMDWTL